MNTSFRPFQNTQEMITFLQKNLQERIAESIDSKDVFRMAISGGSTPKPLYNSLRDEGGLPWEKIEIYQVDERNVPQDSLYSNTRFIEEELIAQHQVKKWQYFDTSLSEQDCLQRYQDELGQIQGSFFDLTLLGMGEDGHTASLFPGHLASLEEEDSWVSKGYAEGTDIEERYTLTFPALQKSQEIWVLMKGKAKQQAFLALSKESPENWRKYPLLKVLQWPQTKVFFAQE